jgi:hypothetical protein
MSSADAARVIVCEPSPRWAVLLRRFAPELQVSEARSLALAEDMVHETPAIVFAIAVTPANSADVLLKLGQWQQNFPECVTAALLDHVEADLELALREAGAQIILTSLFELPQLARVAQRWKASTTSY